MYMAAVELLRERPANILEIGIGIGWGLEQLLKHNCIQNYLGTDPDVASVEYVKQQIGTHHPTNVQLLAHDWLNVPERSLTDAFGGKAHFSFCIEVAEHVEADQRSEFLRKVHRWTEKALFFSTPNIETSDHGVLTTGQWSSLLREAGFRSVSVVEWQWTTFYLCNP